VTKTKVPNPAVGRTVIRVRGTVEKRPRGERVEGAVVKNPPWLVERRRVQRWIDKTFPRTP
jgi:hypothetical protein